MNYSSISSQELSIETEEDIVVVRQVVKNLAKKNDFDPFATTAITTVASELSRNTWRHGMGGTALVELIGNNTHQCGIRLTFEDKGPGIESLDKALAGGFSTARSLGLGLSGSRRLVDHFKIDSKPGVGTTVEVIKWKKPY